VNTCEAGAGFGELAIMDEHLKPRTATIITTEDTYFATLDRKVYMGTLGRFRKKEIETTVKFLADVPVLAPWSGFNLRSWIYMFDRKEIFKRGQILFLENGPPEFIYLIKTGEVKL
jgi:aryl carrier-like protein